MLTEQAEAGADLGLSRIVRHYPLDAPQGYIDGMNIYEYVGNSPPENVDPSGLDGQPSSRPSTLPATRQAALRDEREPNKEYLPVDSLPDILSGKSVVPPASFQLPEPLDRMIQFAFKNTKAQNFGAEWGGVLTCSRDNPKELRAWKPITSQKSQIVHALDSAPTTIQISPPAPPRFLMVGNYHTHPTPILFSSVDLNIFLGGGPDDTPLWFSMVSDCDGNVYLLAKLQGTVPYKEAANQGIKYSVKAGIGAVNPGDKDPYVGYRRTQLPIDLATLGAEGNRFNFALYKRAAGQNDFKLLNPMPSTNPTTKPTH